MSPPSSEANIDLKRAYRKQPTTVEGLRQVFSQSSPTVAKYHSMLARLTAGLLNGRRLTEHLKVVSLALSYLTPRSTNCKTI
ncbi:hypothetical protein AVEN_99295-1 [Araneus ventricosus]|uniref:Uncharacterized protein n=1 Tax=Araneus ventricosus TaxID=182803 RepID=A0A4Y2JTS0_ARAVE|nr:hypothetical protein AVEN_99295-1 [Araneus ventricosus]